MGRGFVGRSLYFDDLDFFIAVSKDQISVLQGIVQAVGHMAGGIGVAWIVAPFALMLSISIAGIGSAWLAGSARIPFVAGLDSYLPKWLGRIHPKYGTPYAALILHAVVSVLLVGLNFLGGGVQETFQKLLSLAVVLQLVPFLYMFAALLKLAMAEDDGKGRYSKGVLMASGASGLITTILAIIVAFFPAQQITSVVWYEVWMIGGTVLFIGLAAFFFFIYGRRKAAAAASV